MTILFATLSNALYFASLCSLLVDSSLIPSAVSLGLSLLAAIAAGFGVVRGHWQLSSTLLCAVALLLSTVFIQPLPSWLVFLFLVLGLASLLFQRYSAIPIVPRPTGHFPVGLRKLEVTIPDGGPAQCYAFYPAAVDQTSTPRKYLNVQEAEAFSSIHKLLGAPTFLNRHFCLAETHSYEDVAAARVSEQARLPVVVFIHGGGLHPLQNLSLLQDLASHGYLVLAPAFPGITAGIAWHDGEITPISPEVVNSIKLPADGTSDQAAYLLSQDPAERRSLLAKLRIHSAEGLQQLNAELADMVSALLWQLLDEKNNPLCAELTNITNSEQRIYVGMSVGGSVAHSCCHFDKKAVGGVNLDGMNWNFDLLHTDSTVPFLQLYADPLLSVKPLLKATTQTVAPINALEDTVRLPNDSFYATDEREIRFDRKVDRLVWRGKQHMDFSDQPLASRCGNGAHEVRRLNALCVKFVGYVSGRVTRAALDQCIENNKSLLIQRGLHSPD